MLIGLTAHSNEGHKGENENHHPQFNLHKKIMERKKFHYLKGIFQKRLSDAVALWEVERPYFSVRNLFYDPEYDLIN